MLRKTIKWSLRLSALTLFLATVLAGIVLNPSLLYANKTVLGNDTVFHDRDLDPMQDHLSEAAVEREMMDWYARQTK